MAKRSILNEPGGPAAGACAASAAEPASRTLIERAYEQLRGDIIEGRLAPGEKLRVEHMKERYGVSAGTLREAITRLASDALVATEGQRGFRVAPIALEELEDLTRLRVQLETDALRQSMRNGGPAWRAAVGEAFEALSAEEPIRPERRPQWEALNLRFHEALLSGHDSQWTLRVLRLLSRHSERYRSYAITLPGSRRDVHAEHIEIVRYVLAGQEARAALALEAHIRATPDLLIQALREGRAVLPQRSAAESPPP
ncbi:transcriptional regulator [Melaminivora suipulveris]|uniref:Transcriptional regulator n=1 Tax=Melaminivora suipulveris TaxID=2109913 RepID=A0A2R3QBZ1_9BURK|nr:GntR family transcriptional regulator [Melaminivora suipulveris]AVO49194.1 transcriptional regulator [Melaminivora suipulveris]